MAVGRKQQAGKLAVFFDFSLWRFRFLIGEID